MPKIQIPLADDKILSDPKATSAYASDEAATGSTPLAVVFPVSAKEVSQVLTWAHENKTPVIPRGAGSGLSGGAIPLDNSVILSLEKMNQHLEINTSTMTATVDAGVITGEVRAAAADKNLLYAPIPASVDFCTIGGNVATNAGGLCAVKYGVTREHVLSVEAVLPTGEVIETGGHYLKSSTGYNLTHLLCGSEGTLAVITRITLKLLPLPPSRATLLVPFDSAPALTKGVLAILEGSIIPPTLEFLPKDAVQCVLARHPEYQYPFPEKEASLLIELDGNDTDLVMSQAASIADILGQHGAGEPVVALNETKREELWTLRKQVRDSIANSGDYIEADSVVPRSELPALYDAAMEAAHKSDLSVISYGHAGDGNLHTYFLRGDLDEETWNVKSHEALQHFFEKTKDLGGTLSGEHGIGYLKRDYLPIVMPPEQISLMKRIKQAFDPHNILNPHKVLPE